MESAAVVHACVISVGGPCGAYVWLRASAPQLSTDAASDADTAALAAARTLKRYVILLLERAADACVLSIGDDSEHLQLLLPVEGPEGGAADTLDPWASTWMYTAVTHAAAPLGAAESFLHQLQQYHREAQQETHSRHSSSPLVAVRLREHVQEKLLRPSRLVTPPPLRLSSLQQPQQKALPGSSSLLQAAWCIPDSEEVAHCTQPSRNSQHAACESPQVQARADHSCPYSRLPVQPGGSLRHPEQPGTPATPSEAAPHPMKVSAAVTFAAPLRWTSQQPALAFSDQRMRHFFAAMRQ
ncbi:hypothetical protein cyc_01107 [Cyclospora cayetanensis]|uniref:Uncharacterized protein n=1 Tax=Cyclospora cayetanensis TaxID=88456 RepID=A0A1D3CYJ2_9EIME|nr:hypothetical protein cyc_01107 [Cyclospora cayetanensis]